jgi:voltage-gated potassium channel
MTGDIDNSGSIYASFPADPRERRRVVGRTLLRSLAVTVGLLLLYAFVPVPERFGLGALLGLTVGLVVFVILVGWQIRAIVRAEHPVLRAVEVLAFAVPLLVVVFAFTYLSLSRADSGSFSEHLSRIDAMYYTVSTTCTVGFGDVTAETNAARILVTLQMLFDLALIAILVRLVILATRAGVYRRTVGAEPGPPDAG